MHRPAISVVVVSRERPDALTRCLSGLGQQFAATFEVIVIADPAGCAAAACHPLARHLRILAFDRANISAARNAGITAAGGEIVAFLDDDAIPEPTWLRRLTAPFTDPAVAASGGFVIGRNGISLQWRARSVDSTGAAHPLALPNDVATVPVPPEGRVVKTEGTNMAVRASVLRDLGGFDNAFAFYLDETDLNMRIARAGLNTAIVPRARVHHGFAASARRRADRLPLSLFDIGASSAAFWTRHLPVDRYTAARNSLRAEQRRRLLDHLVRGTAEPRDLRRLMATLERGLAEGATGPTAPVGRLAGPGPFSPLPAALTPVGSQVLAGGRRDSARLFKQAQRLRAEGLVVTVLVLSRTALYHRVSFVDPGIWVQTGGIHGRSERDQPLFRRTTHAGRIAEERERIAKHRDDVDSNPQS